MPATVFAHLDAILFDLDGTLIDSTPVTTRAWKEWGDELGIKRTDYHEHGVPARGVIAGLIATDDLDESQSQYAYDLINHKEETDTDGVTVLPGALEFLSSIPQERWTIVTSCTDALAAARLGAVQWQAPPLIVTASQVTNGKPDPEGYLLAAKRLGADPAKCLVVEDAPAGLAAAHAAGMQTLGLTGTYPREALKADVVLDGLRGVVASVTPAGLTVSVA